MIEVCLRKDPNMNQKHKVALIGCGGIAESKHIPSLLALDNVEIKAFCDIIPERAEEAAVLAESEGYICEDYMRIVEDHEIEAVHVLTPNREHAEITVRCLEAGKHVLCEKPMAISRADGQKMLDAARKSGKILSIAYQNRQRPDVQYLKQLIEDGDLGEIYYARA